MPYRPDTAFDTDDSFARLAPDTASPRDLFYALTAQGVPPQQAMTAAYARDSDVVHATLQAYGRPVPDTSAAASVQPMSARGTSVFPDPPPMPQRDDARRGRPGFTWRADGGDGLDPAYLDSRPEQLRRSGWGSSVPHATREDLDLPQGGNEQFAGVGLSRDVNRGYGLDPYYAAQTRRALDAEPRVPSWQERLFGDGMFTEGLQAMPFSLAGPGSLNFDPALESSSTSLAPFERSLEDVQRANRPRRAGNYAGGYIAGKLPKIPVGLGGGAYIDDSGHIYPQGYLGSPGGSFAIGHSEDLDSQLTGPSGTGTVGKADGRLKSGAGVVYGFGPYDLVPWWIRAIQKRLP